MVELGRDELLERLQSVGEHLAGAGESVAIVVVGGAALSLGKHLRRTTEDVDIYAQAVVPPSSGVFVSAQQLPDALVRAAAKVARDYQLPDSWMNSVVAPQDLSDPPPGFMTELHWLHLGGLMVDVVGRAALIALKLHALRDV